jgi:hypothetical protein
MIEIPSSRHSRVSSHDAASEARCVSGRMPTAPQNGTPGSKVHRRPATAGRRKETISDVHHRSIFRAG